MKLKHGVNPDGVCREIWWALGKIDTIYGAFGEELVVTSLADGTHSTHSKHYVGEAADLRTRYFVTLEKVTKVYNAIKLTIDPLGFDTVLESDHIHIEWDPKPGEKFLTYCP